MLFFVVDTLGERDNRILDTCLNAGVWFFPWVFLGGGFDGFWFFFLVF